MNYIETTMTKWHTDTTFDEFMHEWGEEVDWHNQPFLVTTYEQEADMYIYQPRKEAVYVITITDGAKHIRTLRKLIKKADPIRLERV